MPNPTDKKILASAAVKLWDGAEDSLEPAGDSANFVFSFLGPGGKFYLRLTPPGARTKNQIEAELDFIGYLRRNGVSAAPAVPSVSASLLEEISVAGRTFFACVFGEAEGERFSYDPAAADFNKEHFRLRGRTLGQIHALSKKYIPPPGLRRFAWDEDDPVREAGEFLPGAETIVWREFLELKSRLEDHPQTGETFGLIHGDFGETNYRFRLGRLDVFDFDDSCYHWYAYDLAVSIYPHGWRREGLKLLDRLLEGYAEKTSLRFTPGDITTFCRWRLVYMFLVYARKWGFRDLTPRQAEWFARKRENIARGYSWGGDGPH